MGHPNSPNYYTSDYDYQIVGKSAKKSSENRRWMVPAMAKAAVAVGADGLIIEVHYNPEKALSDGSQSLSLNEFNQLMLDLKKIIRAIDRDIF